MSRNVQILLISACTIPWLTIAGEETMEERKRRIARKYLRERVEITYSDEQVPGDVPTDEELYEIEELNEIPSEIDREEARRNAYRPPPVRQRAQLAENPNWLLADPEEQDGAYPNPYGQEDTGKSDRSSRETDFGTSQSLDAQREVDIFGRELRQPANSSGTTGQQSIFSPRSRFGENTQSGYSQQQDGLFSGRAGTQGQAGGLQYPSTYGAGSQSRDAAGNQYSSGASPYGGAANYSTQPANPYQAQPQSRLPQESASSPYQSPYQSQREQQQWGTYTPYKSPYQAQQEQRQQQWQEQWGNYTPQQEYQRQDAYKEWKRKNSPRYDPAAADSYTQEMMPQ